MTLNDLKYGCLTKKQVEFLDNPTDILTISLEDLPRVPFPCNTSDEALRELRVLNRAMDLGLLPAEVMQKADDKLTDIFEDYMSSVGLVMPSWVEEFTKAMGVYILRLKDEYQRPRPYQLAMALGVPYTPCSTKSGHSPSYPSGHAVQGIALALAFEQEFGSEHPWMKMGREISYSRLQLGVHYPSDKLYGERLGRILFENSRLKKT